METASEQSTVIKIDQEFKSLIPAISPDELKALEQSLLDGMNQKGESKNWWAYMPFEWA